MNITRNNYEEFFMLYADNELPAAERKEVEAFIAANPDLQQELALFQDFKLTPDTALVFTGKEALMKQENGGEAISITNYESFFVLYADDELTNNEKAAVEDFVYHHPQLQAAFELIQTARLSPDNTIVFENKESLYRKEKDDKVIPFGWWKLAVAAMVLLVAGIFWLNYSKKADPASEITKNGKPAVTIPQQPSLHKEEAVAAVDTNRNVQPGKDNVAVAAPVNKNSVKPIPVKNVVLANDEKLAGNHNKTKPETVTANDDAYADNKADDRLTGSNITSIESETGKKAGINTAIAAAAGKSVINHQLVYRNTAENDNAIAEQAVATNTNDKLEVLNTSVNTKNSLRGFFRKASRLIAKKTNSDDDSTHKSILIGGFEIAVR